MTTEALIVGPQHPAWVGLDDDDWNGATFGQWLRNLDASSVIILRPGVTHNADKVARMVKCLQQYTEHVSVELPS